MLKNKPTSPLESDFFLTFATSHANLLRSVDLWIRKCVKSRNFLLRHDARFPSQSGVASRTSLSTNTSTLVLSIENIYFLEIVKNVFCKMFSESYPCLLGQNRSCRPTACRTLRKHFTKPFSQPDAPVCVKPTNFFAQNTFFIDTQQELFTLFRLQNVVDNLCK